MAKPAAHDHQASPLPPLLELLDGEDLSGVPAFDNRRRVRSPGRYSDGVPGSSLVVASAFLGHTALDRFKRVKLICNEQSPARNALLAPRLDALPKHRALEVSCRAPEDFLAAQPSVHLDAHDAGTGTPTLWILDPFEPKNTPFSCVSACLKNPRDEVIITWFTDEIYRFRTTAAFETMLSDLYGSTAWNGIAPNLPEGQCKAELLEAYRAELEKLPNVRTGQFSIAGKNESARLTLIFATHDDRGLECWNQALWKLDPSSGQSASERRGLDQGVLAFTDLTRLRSALLKRAGTSVPFETLLSDALREGYQEPHLREALDALREDGLAGREEPAEAKSEWPSGSVVRFWNPGSERS